jgi:hypothetical protein
MAIFSQRPSLYSFGSDRLENIAYSFVTLFYFHYCGFQPSWKTYYHLQLRELSFILGSFSLLSIPSTWRWRQYIPSKSLWNSVGLLVTCHEIAGPVSWYRYTGRVTWRRHLDICRMVWYVVTSVSESRKMETVCFSETLLHICETTRRNNTDDHNMQYKLFSQEKTRACFSRFYCSHLQFRTQLPLGSYTDISNLLCRDMPWEGSFSR